MRCRTQTIRAAAASRMPLDGADAQALEHALTHAENDPRAHDTAADLVRATSTWKTT